MRSSSCSTTSTTDEYAMSSECRDFSGSLLREGLESWRVLYRTCDSSGVSFAADGSAPNSTSRSSKLENLALELAR